MRRVDVQVPGDLVGARGGEPEFGARTFELRIERYELDANAFDLHCLAFEVPARAFESG